MAGLKSISYQPLVYGFIELAVYKDSDKVLLETWIETITEYDEPKLLSTVQT